MDKVLLNHIKEIELLLEQTKQKEEKLKKISLNLTKLCQSIIDLNLNNQSIQNKIVKYLSLLNSNLTIKDIEYYYSGSILNRDILFKILKEFDYKKYLFFIFKLRDSNELEFAFSFIESKFSPFITIDINRVIGVISKDKLKEFERIKFIPFFKKEYKELQFFISFFEIEEFDKNIYHKTIDLFDRFYLKPSFENKHYLYYSLIDKKIIDFETRQKEAIKKEYAFVYEMQYPQLDLKVRQEIKNIKFILSLLDRIDNELREIKKSKGTIIVVKRILSFIHKNQLDPQIQQMTELISKELDE